MSPRTALAACRRGVAGAILILGCAGCGDGGSSPDLARSWSSDSLRAVRAAGAEYRRIDSGAALDVDSIWRDGEDIVVEFFEGPEYVGGGARLRVDRNGAAVLEELYQ